MKTAFLYRLLSSTKENSEISLVVALGEEANRDMIEAGLPFSLSEKTPTIVHEGKTSDMDSNPNRHNPNFVDLLNSQQDIAFGSYEDSVELSSSQVLFLLTQGKADSDFVGNTPPDRSSKKRKVDEDGADCSSSQPTETMRPEGVKAAKARGKKTVVEENEWMENAVKEFQSVVSLKQQDLVLKDRLSKNMLLDSLIIKKEPLDDEEQALKKKLISDLLSN
ncbi:hypothetical protein Bca4012_088087 [Brassica carinata]|uniref:No apical meristem-associated C-terminal domain-containing protein n=1 Tax=Brassica carinata TaxID=52824 RepID=A0A8X7P9Q1_BRACI|nr:hypothetical protein Bca52824_088242 [Brassica carinata]